MAFASSLDQLPVPQRTPAERFREALALFEEGIDMKRRSLERQYPQASEAEREALLLRWLRREGES